MTQSAREFSDFQFVSTLSAQLPWLAFPEVLWILVALRNFWEAFRSFGRCFWEMLTLSQGTEELWAVIFLPAAAFRAVIFCQPRCSELHSVQWGHLFSGVCGIRCRQCYPLFWHLQNSVPETPSYGTRRVFKGAKQPTTQTVDSLLLHRTHFQRRRTASCCTECTFGCPTVPKPFHNSIQKWQSLRLLFYKESFNQRIQLIVS